VRCHFFPRGIDSSVKILAKSKRDANDTELRRHPVEHFAGTLADRMQSAAAASANFILDSQQSVFARQRIPMARTIGEVLVLHPT
jgi:hypothetical protein